MTVASRTVSQGHHHFMASRTVSQGHHFILPYCRSMKVERGRALFCPEGVARGDRPVGPLSAPSPCQKYICFLTQIYTTFTKRYYKQCILALYIFFLFNFFEMQSYATNLISQHIDELVSTVWKPIPWFILLIPLGFPTCVGN